MRAPRAALGTVITAALAAAVAAPLHAQSIRGALLDSRTGRPVSDGAVVLLREDGERITTVESAADGTFLVRAPSAGTYDLYAERLGYYAGVATFELAAEQEVVIEFRLEPSALAMDSIDVSVRPTLTPLDRVGFTSRSRGGVGHFLTREELLERGPQRDITDVLRTLTGVQTDQRRFGPDRLLLRRGSTPLDPRPYCEPFLFLDGLPVQPPWEDLVDLDDVAAVEVYPDASRVPASFASRAQSCGVVVVWTLLQYGGGG